MTEQFHYPTASGAEIVLPRFKNLPVGVVRRNRKEDDAEQAFALLEAVAAPEALDVIDAMGLEEFGELMAAWQKDSGVSLGESSAS